MKTEEGTLKEIIQSIIYNLEENVNFQKSKKNMHPASLGRYENALEIQNTINEILKIYEYEY